VFVAILILAPNSYPSGNGKTSIVSNGQQELSVVKRDSAACGSPKLVPSNGKRVLVTGVGGFIASHVARYCMERLNMQVVGVDSLLAYGLQYSLPNIPNGTVFVRGDLKDYAFVERLFREYGPFTFVYHFAAYAGQGMSNFIRNHMFSTNLVATTNLVNQAVNTEVTHLVFLSSCAVYGSGTIPKPASGYVEDVPITPDDPYGISKYASELDIRAANKQFGLSYTIFRAHNVYGPHQGLNDPYRNVLSILMRQIMYDKEVTIFGDGMQTRSFTYIDDVVPLFAEAPLHSKASGETLNAGSEETHTLLDVVQLVGEALNKQPKVRFLPARRESEAVEPDHTKQNMIFQDAYTKVTPLAVGLKEMASWARGFDWREDAPHTPPEITRAMPPHWLQLFVESGASPGGRPYRFSCRAEEVENLSHLDAPAEADYSIAEEPLSVNVGAYKEQSTCRFDGHPLTKVIDFGYTPLGNNFLPADSTQADFDNEPHYPLTVMFCPYCGSLQVNIAPQAQTKVLARRCC